VTTLGAPRFTVILLGIALRLQANIKQVQHIRPLYLVIIKNRVKVHAHFCALTPAIAAWRRFMRSNPVTNITRISLHYYNYTGHYSSVTIHANAARCQKSLWFLRIAQNLCTS
jgi:hypothetical protein